MIISNIKEPFETSGPKGDWQFVAKPISLASYYPYGKELVDGSYSSDLYKFGFNGMEKEDHHADGNQFLNFGARVYNSDIGSFLSKDPLKGEFLVEKSLSFQYNKSNSTY